MVNSAILNTDVDLASWGPTAVLRTDGVLHGGGGAVTLLLKKNGRSGAHIEIAGLVSAGTMAHFGGGVKVWFVWAGELTASGAPRLMFVQHPGETVVIPAGWFHAVLTFGTAVLIGTLIPRTTNAALYGKQAVALQVQLSNSEQNQDAQRLMAEGVIPKRKLDHRADVQRAYKRVRALAFAADGKGSNRLDARGRIRRGKGKRLTKPRKPKG